MRIFICLLLGFILILSAGCSRKVIVIKAGEPETREQKVFKPANDNVKASEKHLVQAKKFYHNAKYKQAQKHCEKSITFNRRNWEAHYYLGLTMQQRKRYTISIESFGAGLKYCPENNFVKSEIHFAIGKSWEKLGHLDHARKEFAVALELNPSNLEAKKAKNRVKIEKTMKGWKKRKNTRQDG
jgi:tetratricopeptide (TPR) repeat protein